MVKLLRDARAKRVIPGFRTIPTYYAPEARYVTDANRRYGVTHAGHGPAVVDFLFVILLL